ANSTCCPSCSTTRAAADFRLRVPDLAARAESAAYTTGTSETSSPKASNSSLKPLLPAGCPASAQAALPAEISDKIQAYSGLFNRFCSCNVTEGRKRRGKKNPARD